MKLKPLGDRVVIEKPEEVSTTKSGIVLPDNASKEKPQTGKVVAVGPGRTLDNGTVKALEVKSGDEVYYSKYAGAEIKIEEKEYIILAEAEILAVIA